MMGKADESRRRTTPLLCEWTALPSADRVLWWGPGPGNNFPDGSSPPAVAGIAVRLCAGAAVCALFVLRSNRKAQAGRCRGPLDRERKSGRGSTTIFGRGWYLWKQFVNKGWH
jgi:hypothetical protein